MSKLVTIFGGSGFVGRYIARRMAHAGWRVRVAVRKPNEALFVKPYGTVGQVEPVFCNVRDDHSVETALRGADAVVNCVGILGERGPNKFDPVQHEGAARIARLAAAAGVEKLVHFSAIGADLASKSDYARSKALGEQAVLKYFPSATILRPSVVFGNEDKFFNKFAGLTAFTWVLPIVGGNSKFQPVYVDDIAAAAQKALTDDGISGVYELGGPDVKTLTALINDMLKVIERRRLVLNLPFFVGSIMGYILDIVQKISMRIFYNSFLTRDQVRQLRHDNVVSDAAKTLDDLGIAATPYAAILPDYLWRFRPSGEFSAIKESAKKLKKPV